LLALNGHAGSIQIPGTGRDNGNRILGRGTSKEKIFLSAAGRIPSVAFMINRVWRGAASRFAQQLTGTIGWSGRTIKQNPA
jgi:hypothetical protein